MGRHAPGLPSVDERRRIAGRHAIAFQPFSSSSAERYTVGTSRAPADFGTYGADTGVNSASRP
ncbi:hypothetical protein ABZ348_03930 [Streptomyces sp. NPDC005963]|uniref:hypothetical protein n=1 Tax=Streptomyces sp. NPDC005963 TaxID=3156721 RepID=UPI0034018E48